MPDLYDGQKRVKPYKGPGNLQTGARTRGEGHSSSDDTAQASIGDRLMQNNDMMLERDMADVPVNVAPWCPDGTPRGYRHVSYHRPEPYQYREK